MKVGLLVISTGAEYHKFIKPLLSSVDRYFLRAHDLAVHLWTDSTAQYRVKHQFLIKGLEWPYPTLYRYHYFLEQFELLADYDHLFYLDVDMLVVDRIGDEVLSDSICATQHPGYVFQKNNLFPYEQNPSSTAYLPRQQYFAGGFQGGKTDAYLKMARTICQAIDADLQRNFIACWNDESHYNRFLSSAPPGVVLDPSYCYPEDAAISRKNSYRDYYIDRWGRDYRPKIIALTKHQRQGAPPPPPPLKRTGLRKLARNLKVRWRGY